MVYLMETNANVYSWLVEFYKANPIPKVGGHSRCWGVGSGRCRRRRTRARVHQQQNSMHAALALMYELPQAGAQQQWPGTTAAVH